MLVISALLSTGCAFRKAPAPEMVVIPADREVRALPDGNYEVTPAWLQDRYEYEAWITDQLESCRKTKGSE